MRTNKKTDNDTVIDFISMNYLSNLSEINKIIGLRTESFLNLILNKNVKEIYDSMINEGFTEIIYSELELDIKSIEKLITKYKANPNILILIKNGEEHDVEFFEQTLQFSTESYINNELLEYIYFAKNMNINFLELVEILRISKEINVLECLFNIALINEYKIDIESIIEYKKLYPMKTGEYDVIWENVLKLPGVKSILTPIYKHYDKGTSTYIETKLEVQYNFEEFKFNEDVLTPTGSEVYTETFFNIIQDKINAINYTTNKLSDEYKYYMKNKALKTLGNKIDKYLLNRVIEIADSVISCSNLENLKYQMKKAPLFCFTNDKLILEKMEYTQHKVNQLLKDYNAIPSS